MSIYPWYNMIYGDSTSRSTVCYSAIPEEGVYSVISAYLKAYLFSVLLHVVHIVLQNKLQYGDMSYIKWKIDRVHLWYMVVQLMVCAACFVINHRCGGYAFAGSKFDLAGCSG